MAGGTHDASGAVLKEAGAAARPAGFGGTAQRRSALQCGLISGGVDQHPAPRPPAVAGGRWLRTCRGFSAEALRERIDDAQAVCLITADGGYRRGKMLPLLAAAEQAVSEAKTVRQMVVVRRHPTGTSTGTGTGTGSGTGTGTGTG